MMKNAARGARAREAGIPLATLYALSALVALGSGCASSSQGSWARVAAPAPTEAGRSEPAYAMDRREAATEFDFADVDGAAGGEVAEEIYRVQQTTGRSRGESAPDEWGSEGTAAAPPLAPGDQLLAEAVPAAAAPGTSAAAAPTGTNPPTASDANPPGRPLLIYTATLNLAVHHVEDQQNALVELARSHGGYLARRSGAEIVIRVPAQHFEEALTQAEALGDVLARTVDAQDVTEQFRDTRIRLRNLVAMRDRLEQLLAEADDVDEALAVERQMERITTEIELLRGRLRSLEDRIAYSTITVRFRARPTTQEQVDEFQLPFRWLHRLGLQRLMEVR